MPPIPRREFVQRTLAGGAALIAPRSSPSLAGRPRSLIADSHIEILLDEPIGTIAP